MRKIQGITNEEQKEMLKKATKYMKLKHEKDIEEMRKTPLMRLSYPVPKDFEASVRRDFRKEAAELCMKYLFLERRCTTSQVETTDKELDFEYLDLELWNEVNYCCYNLYKSLKEFKIKRKKQIKELTKQIAT